MRIHNLLEVRLLHREAAGQLQYLAHYDPLTGLPNRQLFYESLERSLVQAEKHHWNVSVLPAAQISKLLRSRDKLLAA